MIWSESQLLLEGEEEKRKLGMKNERYTFCLVKWICCRFSLSKLPSFLHCLLRKRFFGNIEAESLSKLSSFAHFFLFRKRRKIECDSGGEAVQYGLIQHVLKQKRTPMNKKYVETIQDTSDNHRGAEQKIRGYWKINWICNSYTSCTGQNLKSHLIMFLMYILYFHHLICVILVNVIQV